MPLAPRRTVWLVRVSHFLFAWAVLGLTLAVTVPCCQAVRLCPGASTVSQGSRLIIALPSAALHLCPLTLPLPVIAILQARRACSDPRIRRPFPSRSSSSALPYHSNYYDPLAQAAPLRDTQHWRHAARHSQPLFQPSLSPRWFAISL